MYRLRRSIKYGVKSLRNTNKNTTEKHNEHFLFHVFYILKPFNKHLL